MSQVNIDSVAAAMPDLDTLSLSPDWNSLGAVGAQNVLSSTAGLNGISNGYVYTTTTTGTSGYNWNVQNSPTTISGDGQMHLQGDRADIRINGRSMSDWMAKVEERLNILTPNPELEREWDQLRRLGERYRRLEKKCQEKARMWQQLKSMTPPRP